MSGRKRASARAVAWTPIIGGRQSFGVVYGAESGERIRLVREGVPAAALGALARDLGVSKERLYGTLGVPRATMERKARANARLSSDESERVIDLARLIGFVEHLVEESGHEGAFDAPRWVARWLEQPLPALGGAAPATLMDTGEGRRVVFGLVAQMHSGAYA